MTVIKSGDLVVLKSGGPIMTVDTVNTDIFDDGKITGILCVWFVGDKLQRVRFDHRAIEPANVQAASPEKTVAPAEETSGEYTVVLDEMVAAMNVPAEAAAAEKNALRKIGRRRKPASNAKRDASTVSPVAVGH